MADDPSGLNGCWGIFIAIYLPLLVFIIGFFLKELL